MEEEEEGDEEEEEEEDEEEEEEDEEEEEEEEEVKGHWFPGNKVDKELQKKEGMNGCPGIDWRQKSMEQTSAGY